MTVSVESALAAGQASRERRAVHADRVLMLRPWVGSLNHLPWERESDHDAIARFLETLGLTVEHVSGHHDSVGDMGHEFDFPRNLPWRALPVILPSCPVHRMFGSGLGRMGRRGWFTRATTSLRDNAMNGGDLFSGDTAGVLVPSHHTELVVVQSAEPSDAELWRSIAFAWAEIERRKIPVHRFDGEKVTLVPWAHLTEVASKGRLRDHLDFNFALNLSLTMSRSVANVATSEGWSSQKLRLRIPDLGWTNWSACTPLAVQIWLSLPDGQPSEECPFDGVDYQEREALLLRGLPSIQKGMFHWSGSGRYPPKIHDLAEVENGHPDNWARFQTQQIGHALSRLRYIDLLDLDADGRTIMTPYGRQIADALGPDLVDPDLPLRWADADETSWPAVDRWLNATFRKVKRRVARISTLPDEAVETLQEDGRTVDLVFGGTVDLTRARSEGVDVDVYVEHVSRGTIPGVGIVRDRAPGVPPSRLWFGIDAGVDEKGLARVTDRGWYSHLDGLSERVVASEASIPEALRPFALRSLSILEVGPASTCTRCPDHVAPSLTMDQRAARDRLVVGWLRTFRQDGHLNSADVARLAIMNRRPPDWHPAQVMGMSGAAFDVTGRPQLAWNGREFGVFEEDRLLLASSDPVRLASSFADHLRLNRTTYEDLFAAEGHVGIGAVRVSPDGHASRWDVRDPIVAKAIALIEEMNDVLPREQDDATVRILRANLLEGSLCSPRVRKGRYRSGRPSPRSPEGDQILQAKVSG